MGGQLPRGPHRGGREICDSETPYIGEKGSTRSEGHHGVKRTHKGKRAYNRKGAHREKTQDFPLLQNGCRDYVKLFVLSSPLYHTSPKLLLLDRVSCPLLMLLICRLLSPKCASGARFFDCLLIGLIHAEWDQKTLRLHLNCSLVSVLRRCHGSSFEIVGPHTQKLWQPKQISWRDSKGSSIFNMSNGAWPYSQAAIILHLKNVYSFFTVCNLTTFKICTWYTSTAWKH